MRVIIPIGKFVAPDLIDRIISPEEKLPQEAFNGRVSIVLIAYFLATVHKVRIQQESKKLFLRFIFNVGNSKQVKNITSILRKQHSI